MSYGKLVLTVMVAIFMAVPAFADGVIDDAVKLTQQGLGEEVLVAWAEHQQVGNLTAAEIVHLKEANVPARAIAALIRAGAMNSAQQMVPPPGYAQQLQQQTAGAAAVRPGTTAATGWRDRSVVYAGHQHELRTGYVGRLLR